MKSVRVHAILLLAALLLAFTTWRRDDSPASRSATTVVWEGKPADIASVVFRSESRTLELERRADGGRDYVWGKETAPEPTTAPAPAPRDSAQAAHDTTRVAPPARMRTEEFPVGQNGDALLEGLATLRVVRDLGTADSAKITAYGLSTPEGKLTIRLQDRRERVLSLGNRVVGGGDRYALDSAAHRVYVLANDLLRPFESGSAELRLTELQNFTPDRLAGVNVRTGAGERRMQRQAGTVPAVWMRAGSAQPDQAFSNFMEQLNQLWISRYAPNVSVDSLQSILRIEYLDDDADNLGFMELFRTRGAGARVYYMRTPRTIVPGEVYAPLGERIEQDAATLFRADSPARS
jgi:hypothetical protein